jgi:hypothetical protein
VRSGKSCGLRHNFREQARLHVAAAKNGHGDSCAWQLLTVKEKGSDGHGSTGFGDQLGIGSEKAHSCANFILGNGDDIVHVPANVLERYFSHTLSTQSIGDRACGLFGGQRHDVAGTQASLSIGSELGFNANDPDGTVSRLCFFRTFLPG